MATRFEIVLHGDDPVSLRAAGEEAIEEIQRVEAQLSLFQPGSEIAHLNGRAAHEPVKVTPSLFSLLELAKRLSDETDGAFDITIAPLVKCWGFMGGSGHVPDPADLALARAKVGMHLVHLDSKACTVRFEREGVMLDLGAIGKGYAIERCAALLREAGVQSALLHGGTSTVHAIGRPPGAESWKIAIENPHSRTGFQPVPESAAPPALAIVPLKDEALSVSAVTEKFFRAGNKTLGHVLDPRTGQPALGALLAAVVLPSATETDALSTALLVRSIEGHEEIARLRPGMKTLVAIELAGKLRVETNGIPLGRST